MKLKHAKIEQGKRLGINTSEVERDYDRELPTFCLRYVDSAYCISHCEKQDKAAFADTVRRMSQMTWKDLRMADRHGLGSEKIDRKSIRRPIPPRVPEDAAILAFRFSGMKPMVGYRVKEMFHIIWFDRNFSLYDHE